MPALSLDFGNVALKWAFLDGKTLAMGTDRHAIVPLTDSEWRQVVGRGEPPRGYIRVNGQAFVLGTAARRHLIRQRPAGAARYTREYYGVGLAYAMSESWQKSANVNLFASHAPQDVIYVPQLEAAALGAWDVQSRHGSFHYDVIEVVTFDEPLGGYMHFAFNADGTERRKNALRDATTLVVDIGGHTVDVAAIDPGGVIDPISLASTRTGFLAVMETFEAELRSNNRALFQTVNDLDERRVQDALRTGVYAFGKQKIDCRQEAHGAIMLLVNDTVNVIAAAGSVANFDVVLLTGGGAVVMRSYLEHALPMGDFRLAEEDTSITQFANALGGMKYRALLRLVRK